MNIPEKLVKAVMNSCSTDEKTAREYIENSVRNIHELMDKDVDPSSQTGYGGNYFEEELDNLGLDSDYELAFAELCVYNYQEKEKYTVYVEGDKFETFVDETDAEIAADHEFYQEVVDDVLDEYHKKEGTGGKLTLEDIKSIVSSASVSVVVKNSKGEIVYDCKNEQTIEETAEAIAYNMKRNKMMESRSRRGRMLKENKGEEKIKFKKKLDSIDMAKFKTAYNAIYSTLYELDDTDRVNYAAEIEKTESLFADKSNDEIQEFLKKFYQATYDVPTSDREYAAFWFALVYFHVVPGIK